jgi:hypothetical protein
MSKSQTRPETGKWIEETVTVTEMVPELGKDNKLTFTPKEKTYIEKSIYFDSPKVKIRCADQDHLFYKIKPNTYACEKCQYVRVAHPITYKYNPETKKLELR